MSLLESGEERCMKAINNNTVAAVSFKGRETEYSTTVLQQWFTGKRSLAIPDAVLLSTFTGENSLVQDTTMLR